MRRVALMVGGILALSAAPGLAEAPARATAIFAGGCFWSVEAVFEKLAGVISATSGYIGGAKANPTYGDVSNGGTGHAEAVRVEYDPAKVSYPQLLEAFWRNIDPHDGRGQFCDRGSQYRTGIFVLDESQRSAAEESKRALAASGKLKNPIVTEITAAGTFHPAEREHQDYATRNPGRYALYRRGCGRDARLRAVWGDAKD